MNTKQKQPPPAIEAARRQRLARLLSSDLRGMVRPASDFTFTPAATIRASAIARGAEQGGQR
ncbi:MAG: hypothetical protein H0T51_25415 [Pirellulales bacterium]|nr:hypothetical protein [Pirellulales bacterium]